MAILRKPLHLGRDNSVIRPAGVPSFLGSFLSDDIIDTSSTDIGTTTTFAPSTDTTPGVTFDYSQSGAQAGPDTSTASVAPTPAPAADNSNWLGSALSAFTQVTGAVANTVQQVAATSSAVQQQSQFVAVNARRATQGLPPLTTAQFQSQYGGPVSALLKPVAAAATSQTTYLLLAAAAAGAALLLMKR